MGKQEKVVYNIWRELTAKAEEGFYDLLSTNVESEVYILPNGHVHITRWLAPKNAAAHAKITLDKEFTGEALVSLDKREAARGLMHLWRRKYWWPLMRQLVRDEAFTEKWGDLWDLLAAHNRFEGVLDVEKGMLCRDCAINWAAQHDLALVYRQLLLRVVPDVIPVDEFTEEAAQYWLLHGTCMHCGAELSDGLCASCSEEMDRGYSIWRKGTGVELLCYECYSLEANRGR